MLDDENLEGQIHQLNTIIMILGLDSSVSFRRQMANINFIDQTATFFRSLKARVTSSNLLMTIHSALLGIILTWGHFLDTRTNDQSDTFQMQAKDAKILFLVEWWSTAENALLDESKGM